MRSFGFSFLFTILVYSSTAAATIVVLGDSLAAGTGSVSPTAKTPKNCLADALGERTVKLAIPGLTSEKILRKIPQTLAENPGLIFVSSAGNDAILDYYRPGTYPAEKTMTEMNLMFDQLLASGALIVYLGLQPPYPNTERLPQVAELARQKGVLVVDGMNGLWGSTMMVDEFHPNDRGYELMCDKILAAIKGHYP